MIQAAQAVLTGGFILGGVFGYIANRSHFCTMGAVADIVNMGDWTRMRMWLAAIAAAILGANALQMLGLVDLNQSIYAAPNVHWLANILGGLLFGIGMTMASGCGNRTLVRIGGGNLKSMVVALFMAVSAYATLKGLGGVLRVNWIDPVSVDLTNYGIKHQDLPSLLQAAGIAASTSRILLSALFGIGLLMFALKVEAKARPKILAAVGIGLLVVAGWYVTGHLGYGEDPDTLEMSWAATNSHLPESFTFVGPVAYLLELTVLWTDASLKATFGIVTVLGVVLGSFVAARVSKTFRWEGFANPADLKNHLVGAVLMGFGGVTAMGCTIGQGITGVSTLSIGSFLALAGIILGAVANLKFMYWRMLREA